LRANKKPHPNPYKDRDGNIDTISDKWDKRMERIDEYDDSNFKLHESSSVVSEKDPLVL